LLTANNFCKIFINISVKFLAKAQRRSFPHSLVKAAKARFSLIFADLGKVEETK